MEEESLKSSTTSGTVVELPCAIQKQFKDSLQINCALEWNAQKLSKIAARSSSKQFRIMVAFFFWSSFLWASLKTKRKEI